MARCADARQSHERKDSPSNERGISQGTEVPHPADDRGRQSRGIRHAILKVQLQGGYRQPGAGFSNHGGIEGPVSDVGVYGNGDGTPYKRSARVEVERSGLRAQDDLPSAGLGG